MSYTLSSLPAASTPGRIRAATTRTCFIAVICTSAFLLFLIQPMFSKMVVPHAGGSPGVWTTAMLFFQSILLAGYAYAHWLASSFSISRQRIIHLAVTVLAVFALPLAVPEGWTLPQDGTITLWLLALFTVGIGAPFFALSANSPLLQQWYARSGNRDAGDPYFLYAASNIGSFGALLAYPLLIEPNIGLSNQAILWSVGYIVLAVGIAGVGLFATDAPAQEARGDSASAAVAPLSGKQIAFWLLLSFVPSSIMLSVTAKISTDIGSFPLIWVTTLGLYLLTHVFAFSARFRARAGWLPRANGIVVISMVLFATLDTNATKQLHEMAMLLVFLFVTSLCFHTRLASSRPDKRHLTAFFLTMSAGGALGGVFNSVLAPLMFDQLHEFTIATALAFAAAPFVRIDIRRDIGTAILAGALFALVVMAAKWGVGDAFVSRAIQLKIAAAIIAMITALLLLRATGHPLRQIALAGVALTATSLSIVEPTLIERERSFFGVYEVHEFADDNIRHLKHGTTIHGMMRTDTETPQPASYYAKSGPFGQFFNLMDKGDDVGVVGLGAGGLACMRVGEIEKVFYEIDPLVDRIARDPRYFGMLDACGVSAPTVLGDARIEMEKGTGITHDHIVLDAFSSDAIPVHLLTREAFETYGRIIPEAGGIFIHISNRYFNLVDPVARVAASVGYRVYVQRYLPDDRAMEEEAARPVIALAATRDAALGAALAQDARWSLVQPSSAPVWTDDYADTLSALQ